MTMLVPVVVLVLFVIMLLQPSEYRVAARAR
jgi:hypothetical protein